MIVSHKHRFIFLKTPSAAGTSIEIALSSICAEYDVITPLAKGDEVLRTQQGGISPRNYRPSLWLRFRGAKPLYDHMSALALREHVGEEVWRGYRKFAVVRNPWDQLVSLYFMQKKSRYDTFTAFMKDKRWSVLVQQTRDILLINDRFCLDEHLRFENLEDDLGSFLAEIGVKEPPELISAKSGFRNDDGHYREHYSEQSRVAVAEAYQWLNDKFNYVF